MILCTLLLASACSAGSAKEGLGPNENLAPSIVSLELQVAQRVHGTDEAAVIRAKGRLSDGGVVNEPTEWEALDGGEVVAVGDGSIALFSTDEKGPHRVVGRGKGRGNGNGGGGGGGGGDVTDPVDPVVDTITVEVGDVPSPIASISISPTAATVVRSTVQVFTATGLREDGTPATPIVNWSVTGGGTITTEGAGAEFLAGSTIGTWTVNAATDGGETASAQVEVTNAWLLEDFSTYESTADLMYDARDIYTNEVFHPENIALDRSMTMPGGQASMRFDFPNRSGDTSNRCHDYTIGRNMRFPEPVPEVWAEFWVRFTPGFETKAPTEWNCASAADYKLGFLRVSGQSGRFTLTVGQFGHNIVFNAPPAEPDFLTDMKPFPMFQDGQWYRIRFYGSVRDGGRVRLYVNDTMLGDYDRSDGLQVSADAIYGLAMGRNINQGPRQAQSVWWGKVAVYRTNPGW